jgi:hypothetical protein
MSAITAQKERLISRPYSKLNRLCAEARAREGALTTFAAVAKAIDLSPGRVTQMFGYGQESDGITIRAETVGALVKAFRDDGVPCGIDWLYLEYDEFCGRLAGPGRNLPPPEPPEPPVADWELREGTVLADLVELRLHPPRPGNEVRDSYYASATLLFGTAICDVEPDDGEEPRSVSIALCNARLAIGSDGYQPLPGTTLGETGREGENFKRVAGGIEIIGPAPNGTLDGDPIGDQHLAVIAATNTGDAAFAVSVAALRGSFVVGGADAEVSVNKTAILNEFIYRRAVERDDAGRAILAQATMKLRPKETDPE